MYKLVQVQQLNYYLAQWIMSARADYDMTVLKYGAPHPPRAPPPPPLWAGYASEYCNSIRNRDREDNSSWIYQQTCESSLRARKKLIAGAIVHQPQLPTN